MKKSLLFILGLFMILPQILAQNGNIVEVSLSEAGTLADKLAEKGVDVKTVTDLKVTGTVNEEDYWIMSKIMTSLTNIDLSGANIKSIPARAFDGKSTLRQCIVPRSIEYIEESAFRNCTQLINIPFRDKIISIGNNAFENCENMKGDIIFPSSTIKLGQYAFTGCRSLAKVDLSRCKLPTIPNNLFQSCSSVSQVILPIEGENKIGYAINGMAFYGTAITEITIPTSVTAMGIYAFYCKQLNAINVLSKTPIDIKENVFDTVDITKCLLNVPTGSLKAYSFANGWSAFSHIEEIGVKVVIGENGNIMYNGKKAASDDVIFHNASETSFTTIPDPGYVVEKALFNNVEVPVTDNTIKVGANTKSGTLNVSFVLKKYNLDITTEGEGQIKYNEALLPAHHTLVVDSGYTAKFTLIPEEGYTVKSIFYNQEEGAAQQNESVYSTPFAKGDAKLVITFASKSGIGETYKIKTTIGSHGNVVYKNAPLLQESDITVKKGETALFTITPEKYYMIDKVLYGQVDVTNKVTEKGEFTTDAVTNDATLAVSFKLNPIVSIHLVNANTLKQLLPEELQKVITHLTITGNIGEADFNTMRDAMLALSVIDLSQATVVSGGELENYIPYNAFSTGSWGSYSGKKTLTEIRLPINIISIEDLSFSGCINLKKVNFEECTRLSQIGNYAFKETGLTAVRLEQTQITSLTNYQFQECSSLQEITLPKTLETLNAPFRGSIVKFIDLSNCIKLKNIGVLGCTSLEDFKLPSNVESIEDYAFQSSKLKTIYLSVYRKLKKIGKNAFYGNQDLTEIKFPSSLEEVGNNAFSGCNILKLDLSNCTSLTQISEAAFIDNSGLKEVKLPSTLTTIGSSAFASCRLTGTLELPANLTTIGKNAFANNIITICKIAATTPPQMDGNAFDGVYVAGNPRTIAAIFVPENSVTAYKNAEGWKNYTILGGEKRVEINVSKPGNLAIDIMEQAGISPALVTHLTVHGKINDTDFGGMRSNMTVLYSLDLTDAETDAIPKNAFLEKNILMEFKAPKKLISIEASAFAGCTALQGTFNIPDGVTTIGDNAFSGCVNLSGIKLPKNLQTIGYKAFSECSGLRQEITFPNKLKSIAGRAFETCSNLNGTITLPASLESLGDYVFFSCTNLKKADLSLCSSLTDIQEGTFNSCRNMEEVLLPQSLQNINRYAFSDCSKLNDPVFPFSLIYINNFAFSNCSNIKSINLSGCESLDFIGDNAFYNCTSLESINFPIALNYIGGYAFSECRALANISSTSTAPAQLGDYVFKGVNTEVCILSIPTLSYNDYLTAQQWGAFVQMRKAIAVDMTKGGYIEYVNNAPLQEEGPNTAQKASSQLRTAEANNRKGAIAINGSSVYVKKDETVSFFISPKESYEITKVMYNNVDVMSQLVNGVFTTPKVSDKATLSVAFYSAVGNELPQETEREQKLDVHAYNHTIIIRGVEAGVTVSVYAVSGTLQKKAISTGEDITFDLPSGHMYIIRTDRGQTAKIVL